MNFRRSNIITQEESELIRLLLVMKARPRDVKAGLQRLCSHYENGCRLSDPQECRLLVRGLLWDEASIVRRWSYKAIAMVGERNDSSGLIQRLRSEPDIENQTWGIAAIVSLAKDKELRDVCIETGLDQDVPLILAARLFAEPRWLQLTQTPPTINIDRDDALTLKWASLLAGYGRAPRNLFHPQHENRVLLAKLNRHPAPEVSEYSVWALCQNREYQINDLGVPLSEIASHPENVRRWINRLITKDSSFIATNLDLLDDLRRDQASAAREGLALGIRRSYVTGLASRVLDWHDDEREEPICDLLLEHMAYGAEHNVDYGDMVVRNYELANRKSGRRQRLLAASQGTQLYAELRRLDVLEQARPLELALRPAQTLIVIQGDVTVNNKTTFNAGRDIVGQNLVGGDMIGSTSQALQDMKESRDDERRLLTELLKFIEGSTQLPEVDKSNSIKAIEKAAREPGPDSTKGLIAALKQLAEGSAAIAGTTEQIHKFIETISSWI